MWRLQRGKQRQEKTVENNKVHYSQVHHLKIHFKLKETMLPGSHTPDRRHPSLEPLLEKDPRNIANPNQEPPLATDLRNRVVERGQRGSDPVPKERGSAQNGDMTVLTILMMTFGHAWFVEKLSQIAGLGSDGSSVKCVWNGRMRSAPLPL